MHRLDAFGNVVSVQFAKTPPQAGVGAAPRPNVRQMGTLPVLPMRTNRSAGVGCATCPGGMGAMGRPVLTGPEHTALALGATGGSRASAFALEALARNRGGGLKGMGSTYNRGGSTHAWNTGKSARRQGVGAWMSSRNGMRGMGYVGTVNAADSSGFTIQVPGATGLGIDDAGDYYSITGSYAPGDAVSGSDVGQLVVSIPGTLIYAPAAQAAQVAASQGVTYVPTSAATAVATAPSSGGGILATLFGTAPVAPTLLGAAAQGYQAYSAYGKPVVRPAAAPAAAGISATTLGILAVVAALAVGGYFAMRKPARASNPRRRNRHSRRSAHRGYFVMRRAS